MDKRIANGQKAQTTSSKPSGMKKCGQCKEVCGLRTLKCKHCGAPFKRKCRDWDSIALHASTMKDSYIKEKLYDRMDQLSTKPGWTGVLFLVHDSHKKSKSGRIFTHSYSTRGDGQKIEAGLRDSFFKAMKSYLFGSNAGTTSANGLVESVIAKNSVDDEVDQRIPLSSSSQVPASPEEILEAPYNCTSPLPSMTCTVLTSTDGQPSDPQSSLPCSSSFPCPSLTIANEQPTSTESTSVEVVTLSSSILPSSFQDSSLSRNHENVVKEHNG